MINSEISNLVHRANLMLADKKNRTLAFIAARQGEGTTTITRAFAETLAAETHQNILLIDAGPLDAARCMTDGINPALGLVDLIAKGEAPAKAIHTIEHHLSVARWLADPKNRGTAHKLIQDNNFWKSLQENFETIIIDAPSLQTSSDGIALAATATGTILVIEAETTRQPVAENLRDTLTTAGATIIGSVLNKRRFYIPEKIYARL